MPTSEHERGCLSVCSEERRKERKKKGRTTFSRPDRRPAFGTDLLGIACARESFSFSFFPPLSSLSLSPSCRSVDLSVRPPSADVAISHFFFFSSFDWWTAGVLRISVASSLGVCGRRRRRIEDHRTKQTEKEAEEEQKKENPQGV